MASCASSPSTMAISCSTGRWSSWICSGSRAAEAASGGTSAAALAAEPGGAAHARGIAVERRHEAGLDRVGEDVAVPDRGHGAIEALQLREAAAEHDGVRVDQVDDAGERPGEAVLIAA